jgi:hypothetical protein
MVMAAKQSIFVITLNRFSKINGALTNTTNINRTIGPKTSLRNVASSLKKMCPRKIALITKYIAEKTIPKMGCRMNKELYNIIGTDRIERRVKERYLSLTIADSNSMFLVLMTIHHYFESAK